MLQFTFVFAQCVMYAVIAAGIWMGKGELVDATYSLSWLNMSFVTLSPPVCLMMMRFEQLHNLTSLYLRF